MNQQTVKDLSDAQLAGAFHAEGRFLDEQLKLAERRRVRFAAIRDELASRKLLGANGLPTIDAKGNKVNPS